MHREREALEAGLAVRIEGEALQVLVVEIAVREAHRLPPETAHHGQSLGMVLGVEQAHLPADELGMCVRAALGV